MGFAHGWFRMLLVVIPMICFEFLRILEKNRKKGKPEILGKHGLLHCRVGNPRCDVKLRRNVGCLVTARPRCPKGHSSGTLRRSFATPRCRHCSQREFLLIFVSESLVFVHR